MEYKLKNMSWSEFDERRKKAKTIIFPVGACEVYGPHLPLGSDILVAEKVAEQLAKEVNGIVAPLLEVGQSKTLTDYPGTIAISANTLCAVYREMLEEFVRLGFKSFFFLNSHLSNDGPLNEMLEDMKIKHGIKFGLVKYWYYFLPMTQDIWEKPMPGEHAGEAGTSVLLHLYPELVKMDKIVDNPVDLSANPWPGITKNFYFHDYTDIGMTGYATMGTAEKGKIAVDRSVAQMADFIRNYLESDE